MDIECESQVGIQACKMSGELYIIAYLNMNAAWFM